MLGRTACHFGGALPTKQAFTVFLKCQCDCNVSANPAEHTGKLYPLLWLVWISCQLYMTTYTLHNEIQMRAGILWLLLETRMIRASVLDQHEKIGQWSIRPKFCRTRIWNLTLFWSLAQLRVQAGFCDMNLPGLRFCLQTNNDAKVIQSLYQAF